MSRTWSDWMYRLFKSAAQKHSGRPVRRAPRLAVECLEDRLVPATTITIESGTVGTLDAILIANNGTIATTDGGNAAGTISTAALQQVATAGDNISITAQTTLTFDNTIGNLTLGNGTGKSDVFAALGGNISFNDPTNSISTAGAALSFTASAGTLSLGALSTAGGNITVSGGSAGSTGNDIVIDGALTVTGGTGNVLLSTDNNILVNAAISVTGSGLIDITADDDGSGNGTFNNNAAITTAGGNIVITAANNAAGQTSNIGAAINATTGINPTTGMPSRVQILGSRPDVVFDLGMIPATGAIGLTSAELNFVTAGVLQIGNTANTGGIVLEPVSGAAINLASAKVPVLDLITGGTITDAGTNPTPPDLTVSSLSLQAAAGIGTSVAPLETAVGTLTATTTTGNVFVTNAVALTLNAVTTTGAGNIGIVVGNAAAENLAVNGAISTGTGNITLTAGGNLSLLGSATTSGAGVITLAGGTATTGSTILVSSLTALNSATAVQIEGNAAADTFVITPQTNAAVAVTGGLPTTTPGDTLYINPTSVTGASYTAGGVGTGSFTFANADPVTFTGIESVAPIVSVVASTPAASESGAAQTVRSGQFTFTRVGDLSAALTVSYTVGGTAVSGTDYQPLSGQVTFAAGSATATVDVTPIVNATPGGPLTVTVALAATTGYTFVPSATATVTITNTTDFYSTIAFTSATGSVTATRNGTPVFTNFNPGFTGPVTVAVGDVTGDGIPDIVMAGLYGGSDVVAVFDGATTALVSVFVPLPGYTRGLSLAAGDVLGIGRADIVVGLATAPIFGVFDGLSGALLSATAVFPSANVGVNVAVGDPSGTGEVDIIATPTGIAPLVSVYNGTGTLLKSFFAFDPSIATVGLTVAAGDITGTGADQIVLGTRVNGFDYVLIYNSDLTLRAILPLIASNTLPQVAVGDTNGDGVPELLVTVGPIFGAFDGQTLSLDEVNLPFPGQPGNVNVA